jgi:hypothetical protein
MEIGDDIVEDPTLPPEYSYRFYYDKTDASGRYSFRVGPGRFQIAGPGELLFEPPKDEHRVEVSDQETIERNFTAEPPLVPRLLTGRVVDAQGMPAANVLVRGRDGDGYRFNTYFHATTDSEGRFRGQSGGGACVLYARTTDLSQAGFVEVAPDYQGDVTIALGPVGEVRGRIVDSNGQSITDLAVRCAFGINSETRARNGPFHTSALPDSEGRFSIKGLPVGTRGYLYFALEGVYRPGPTFEVERVGAKDLGEITLGPR